MKDKLRTYRGPYGSFKAHDITCADGFKADRRAGLIYGSFVGEDGIISGWEETSMECSFCVLCGPSSQ